MSSYRPNGTPATPERKRERDTRAEAYDHDLAMARLRMFQQQATAGFMRHVLANPASGAQRAKAEERLAAADREAASMAARVGDPDAIADNLGYLPAERRGWHRSSLFDWRHRTLRELKGWQFNAVLAMSAHAKADMCSECGPPADWHTYAVSLCLYRGTPEPGSQAETMARLLPGWWERCAACNPLPARAPVGRPGRAARLRCRSVGDDAPSLFTAERLNFSNAT